MYVCIMYACVTGTGVVPGNGPLLAHHSRPPTSFAHQCRFIFDAKDTAQLLAAYHMHLHMDTGPQILSGRCSQCCCGAQASGEHRRWLVEQLLLEFPCASGLGTHVVVAFLRGELFRACADFVPRRCCALPLRVALYPARLGSSRSSFTPLRP